MSWVLYCVRLRLDLLEVLELSPTTKSRFDFGLKFQSSVICVFVTMPTGRLKCYEALSSDLQKNALAALLRLKAVRKVKV